MSKLWLNTGRIHFVYFCFRDVDIVEFRGLVERLMKKYDCQTSSYNRIFITIVLPNANENDLSLFAGNAKTKKKVMVVVGSTSIGTHDVGIVDEENIESIQFFEDARLPFFSEVESGSRYAIPAVTWNEYKRGNFRIELEKLIGGQFRRSDSSKWWFKIPKIMHFYYGGKVLPFLRFMSIYSFSKLNPEWIVYLHEPSKLSQVQSWTSNEMKYEINPTVDYFPYLDFIPNLQRVKVDFEKEEIRMSNEISEVHKSDIYRWYILNKIGGAFADTDILFIAPMEKMKENSPDDKDVEEIIYTNGVYHYVGFVLGVPGSAYYKLLFESARANYNSARYQSSGAGILCLLGLNSFNEIKNRFSHVSNLFKETVYRHEFQNPNVFVRDDCFADFSESIGIHWYGGLQELRYHLNLMTHENLMQKCTIRSGIEYILFRFPLVRAIKVEINQKIEINQNCELVKKNLCLSELVDMTYILNMDQNKDKFVSILQEMINLGITSFERIRGTEENRRESFHMRAIEDAVLNQYKRILILEDDIKINNIEMMKEVFEFVKNEKFEMFFFLTGLFKANINSFVAKAYIVDKSVFLKILKYNLNIDSIEMIYQNKIGSDGKCFVQIMDVN